MSVSFALVHHANQYLITDGYDNREGISEIVGSEEGKNGMLGVLAAHAARAMPLNLHISGTLLEAIAWHSPAAIHQLRAYIRDGLIELVGSSYGQNIMRFFSPEYNRQQLNEELHLYESLLHVDPSRVKVFWPPERVWETRRMAPALRDGTLSNGGYQYVILDDRMLLSPRDPELPRAIYDEGEHWNAALYQSHEIESGLGLVVFPIAIGLRHSIPPKADEDWRRVQEELEALLVHSADAGESNLLALYADDMEKVIGVWGPDGPQRYGALLDWLSHSGWVRPVKLSDWAKDNPPASRRKIEIGTFAELAGEFKAGEGYENWFYSDDWKPYRDTFEQTERRVKECKADLADSSLIQLAEKQLLVSNWETGWRTPATGAHGDPENHGGPSPWARALTTHCRHALVTAEAASWMKAPDSQAHAEVGDLDADNEPDLVLKSHSFFALVTTRWGGRLVSLFYRGPNGGVMVVGNPCDDWNFLEDLNRFMEKPRNHPGAFADVGFENDRYSCEILEEGPRASVRLTNIEPESQAKGLVKLYQLSAADPVVTVRYRLPARLKTISIECALSPDYLALLRHGSEILKPVRSRGARGFKTRDLSLLLEPDDGLMWQTPIQEWVGHARTVRISSRRREFQLKLRVRDRAAGGVRSTNERVA
jgi:hypothetical protein